MGSLNIGGDAYLCLDGNDKTNILQTHTQWPNVDDQTVHAVYLGI